MKRLRKMMALFLSFAMVIAVLTNTDVKVQAADSNAQSKDVPVTFYFDNSKTQWSEVYAYVWGGGTTTAVKGIWIEPNVYSFTVSSNYQNLLFKNTSGTGNWDQQTADIGSPQSEKIFTPSSSANRTGGSWKICPVSSITVSYDNSKTNWSNVYAYVWSEGNSSITPTVISRISLSGNTYSFKVQKTYKKILFKNTYGTTNWDQQTADTTIPATDGYTFVPYSSNNKTDGYWIQTQTNSVKRRALVLGETSSSAVPVLDVTSMVNMFEAFTFDGKVMDDVVQYNDHTIAEITAKIHSLFANTTDKDISYIYMTCHGGPNGSISIGSDGRYTGAQLRSILDQYVKGKVVLMIDCCYAGVAIDKENTDFADAFLDDFLKANDKNGELAAERFHVICSSNKDETSIGGTASLATKYWEQGCGWLELSSARTSLLADANNDKKVTMKELYDYSYPLAANKQHIVVYPENDSLVIGGRY